MGAGQPHEVLATMCKPHLGVLLIFRVSYRGWGASRQVARVILWQSWAVMGLPGPGAGPFAGTPVCPAVARVPWPAFPAGKASCRATEAPGSQASLAPSCAPG